ncbi:hypothetical protein GCM10028784_18700 [Myceligenerans cantabricum]
MRYRFALANPVSSVLLSSFPDLEYTEEPDGAALAGPITDQAQLHGVINRIEELGLTLVEVRRLPEHEEPSRSRT